MTIPLLFIEGGIGCGKSTLVKHMKDYCTENNYKYLTIQEPVDIWTEIKDKNEVNIIEAFYNDQHKYGFHFQMMAYISRLQRLQEAFNKAQNENYDFIICERSLYTDKNVFCQMLYDEGKIDEYGFKIYNQWFDYFQTSFDNTSFVYLKTDFNVCYERVKKRQRSGENCIDIEYLKQNNQYHDNWLEKERNVLFLDGNQDCEENKDLLNQYCDIILYFMKNDKKN